MKKHKEPKTIKEFIEAARAAGHDSLGLANDQEASYVWLWTVCKRFVEDHHISEPACIGQSDKVIEDAYEFIEHIATIVGYYSYPEED